MKIALTLIAAAIGLLAFAPSSQAATSIVPILTTQIEDGHTLVAIVAAPGRVLANRAAGLQRLERLQVIGANPEGTDGLYLLPMGSVVYGTVSVQREVDAVGGQEGVKTCVSWARVTLTNKKTLPITGDPTCVDGKAGISMGFSTLIQNAKIPKQN